MEYCQHLCNFCFNRMFAYSFNTRTQNSPVKVLERTKIMVILSSFRKTYFPAWFNIKDTHASDHCSMRGSFIFNYLIKHCGYEVVHNIVACFVHNYKVVHD